MAGFDDRKTQRPRTSRFFNRYAHDYDAIYGGGGFLRRIISFFFRRSMRVRFRKTLAGCEPVDGKTALDIGCGPGHYVMALARKGLAQATGIDFAPKMIEIARSRALHSEVKDRCQFLLDDFEAAELDEQFDFVVCMGVMDYVREPWMMIDKAISLARDKVFFSFPVAEGFLAWQRKVRYRSRCDLFLYRKAELERLFSWFSDYDISIEKIGRDYFVTVNIESKK